MSKPDAESSGRPFSPAHSSEVLAGLVRAQVRMMDAVLRQNIETLEFLKTRYEKDRQMLADLSRASDANSMLAVWSSFWSRTMSDYTNEAGTLSAFAAAATGRFLEELKDDAKASSGGAAGTKP